MQISSIQNGSISMASPVSRGAGFVYYDPQDANRDGTVSPAESLAYSLKYPVAGALDLLKSQTSALASPKALNFAYHDPMDANQDGLVSPAEENAYALEHPELEALKRLRTGENAKVASQPGTPSAGQYTKAGKMSGMAQPSSRLVDLFA